MRASVSQQNALVGWWRNEQGSKLAIYQYRSASRGKGYPRESMDVRQVRPDGTNLGLFRARIVDLQRLIDRMKYTKIGDNPYQPCPENAVQAIGGKS